jgi:hypothetical protein
MTTPVDASLPPLAEPWWCTGHYEPSPGEAFHQHNLDHTWGTASEQLRLGLTRFDGNWRAGDERIEVQCLASGDVAGAVGLTDDQARDFIGAALCALATKKRASGSTLALIARCAYEAGRAFAAAIRSSRAESPRTASSHS